ncbi:response regulator [Stenotrophomonas maltophilia]|uniref:response regulator n=1 Tax=Stenotrophomonas maltophilia TaxID=40324 RepID=UPI0034DAC1FA
MTQLSIRVVLADDHPVIRLGLQNALEAEPTLQCVGVACSADELVALLDAVACDVLVTDYAMPGGVYADGLEMITRLRERLPQLRVVVVTGLDQLALVRSLEHAGICQIVSKADDLRHVPAAVLAAYAGRPYASPAIAALLRQRIDAGRTRALSPRELEVIRLYVQGQTISQIAEQLGRKKQTVSTQKNSALRKLGVANESELYTFAAELKLDGILG